MHCEDTTCCAVVQCGATKWMNMRSQYAVLLSCQQSINFKHRAEAIQMYPCLFKNEFRSRYATYWNLFLHFQT